MYSSMVVADTTVLLARVDSVAVSEPIVDGVGQLVTIALCAIIGRPGSGDGLE